MELSTAIKLIRMAQAQYGANGPDSYTLKDGTVVPADQSFNSVKGQTYSPRSLWKQRYQWTANQGGQVDENALLQQVSNDIYNQQIAEAKATTFNPQGTYQYGDPNAKTNYDPNAYKGVADKLKGPTSVGDVGPLGSKGAFQADVSQDIWKDPINTSNNYLAGFQQECRSIYTEYLQISQHQLAAQAPAQYIKLIDQFVEKVRNLRRQGEVMMASIDMVRQRITDLSDNQDANNSYVQVWGHLAKVANELEKLKATLEENQLEHLMFMREDAQKKVTTNSSEPNIQSVLNEDQEYQRVLFLSEINKSIQKERAQIDEQLKAEYTTNSKDANWLKRFRMGDEFEYAQYQKQHGKIAPRVKELDDWYQWIYYMQALVRARQDIANQNKERSKAGQPLLPLPSNLEQVPDVYNKEAAPANITIADLEAKQAQLGKQYLPSYFA